MTLLSVKGLKKHYRAGGQILYALDGVSFEIYNGEVFSLVGESGSGKSTAAKTILRLQEPTAGEVIFDGQDLSELSKKELKATRRDMQIIFQNPWASLNPRMTVLDIIGEPLDIHKLAKGKARLKRVEELLNLVGLSHNSLFRYPHEFSGGQRQRIGIARALASKPKFLICDEPISALDLSIQAQVVNLLKQLQNEMDLTYLFIAHDLAMVRHLSDRVGVMYLGNLVELAPTESLYERPLHPYTQALLSAAPIPDPKREKNRSRIVLQGEMPSPINPPSGCPFHTRCPMATPLCSQQKPTLKEVSPGHHVACFLHD